jgi:hypothetical protein
VVGVAAVPSESVRASRLRRLGVADGRDLQGHGAAPPERGSALGSLGGFWEDPWLQVKLALALALVAIHVYLARCVKVFAGDGDAHSAAFFRVLGEVPMVLMILIVLLVVLKPS